MRGGILVSDERGSRLALLFIVLFGLALRFFNLNWDLGTHIHPDERFLTLVAEAIRFPPLSHFFDTAASPANPHNAGHRFFVYGTLPLFLDRALCFLLSGARGVTYDTLVPVQRSLSAAADTVTLLLVALLAGRLAGTAHRRAAMLVAGLLYAALPLAVQQAHFGTVDALGTMFIALVVFLVLPDEKGGVRPAQAWLLAGAALGAAAACKPNLGLYGGIAALCLLFARERPENGDLGTSRSFTSTARDGALLGLAAFLVFRIAQPYAFAGPGFFGLSLNEAWLENLSALRDILTNSFWYAPGIQWIDRVFLLEPAKNLFVWGTGPALGLLIVVSSAALLFRGLLRREPAARRFLPLLLFVSPLLLWQATRPVASVRHAHAALPLLTAMTVAALPLVFGRFARLAGGLAVVGTLFAGFSLLSIYAAEPTRVSASRRLAELYPRGARVAYEYWDDPLPLALPGIDPSLFPARPLPVFEVDTAAKAERVLDGLVQCDVLVLSSRRGLAPISRVPDAFPFTSEYYRLLLSGALGFENVGLFEHRPGLGPLRFDDRGAEETLSVYDHPVVHLFRKTRHFSRVNAAALLFRGPTSGDPALTPDTVIARGVPPDETPQARWRGASSPPPPRARGTLGNLLSLFRWGLGLELLGVLGFLLLRPVLCNEPMGGFGNQIFGALARPLGFAVAGLGWSWLGFFVPGFQRLAIPLAIGGAVLTLATPLGRSTLSALKASRALFFGIFLLFLLIRTGNPEVFWGEKPMDGAILSAVLRAPRLPIPEPWFVGAPLDYYAQGFLPVALLARVAHASAGLAFNLTAATLPAFLGAAVYAVGLALSRRRLGGAAALVLTLLSGTLAPLFNKGFRADPFGFNGLWSASRVIPDGIDEFPLFTALFADIHAHFLSWAPFSALLLLAILRMRNRPPAGSAADRNGALLLGLLAAAVHLTNPWETPLAAMLLIFSLPPASKRPLALRDALASAVEPFLFAFGAALAAASPTLLFVRSAPVSLAFFSGTHASPLAYLELFGLPLLILAIAWIQLGLSRDSALRLAGLLGLCGIGLLLFGEFFVVADRMNTLFKFGLQARVLVGVAAGALVPALLGMARARGGVPRLALAFAGCLALVSVGAGGAHVISILRTRRVPGPRPALDGFAYVAAYDPEGERRMNELNRRPGLPTIFDPPGSPYSASLQTTMRTGCPTLVGWPWHLRQRRRSPLQIALRERDAAAIASGTLAEEERRLLLSSYGVNPDDPAGMGKGAGVRR